MSPIKLVDEVIAIIRKYLPIMVVHFAFIAILNIYIIDPKFISGELSIWDNWKTRFDSALAWADLTLELWYVLTFLLIAYLLIIQGLIAIILKLPVIRLRYRRFSNKTLIRKACKVLKTEPELSAIHQRLSDLVYDYRQEFLETNQTPPYKSLEDEQVVWLQSYGTLVLFLLVVGLWLFQGARYSISSISLLYLFFFLLAMTFIARFRWKKALQKTDIVVSYMALWEYEKQSPPSSNDLLQSEKVRFVLDQMDMMRARRRNPGWLLMTALKKIRYRKMWRITKMAIPRWMKIVHGPDWNLLTSLRTKYAQEEYTPPIALRADEFEGQFTSLLECTGAGLFLLVPKGSGLAPAVEKGGSSYCFAERRHGGHTIPISLTSRWDQPHLSGSYTNSFLLEIGPYPIEKIAEREFGPFSDALAITKPDLDEGTWPMVLETRYWPQQSPEASNDQPDMQYGIELPLNFGSTYLLRSEDVFRNKSVVAFQCYSVEGTSKVLVAWKFIWSFHDDEKEVSIPWWRFSAWKELFTGIREEIRTEKQRKTGS